LHHSLWCLSDHCSVPEHPLRHIRLRCSSFFSPIRNICHRVPLPDGLRIVLVLVVFGSVYIVIKKNQISSFRVVSQYGAPTVFFLSRPTNMAYSTAWSVSVIHWFSLAGPLTPLRSPFDRRASGAHFISS
jgi:hypothetical protein